jgi:tetratricopeptide (TPR) repeat protein
MINRRSAAILGGVVLLSIQAFAQPPAPRTDREKQQLEARKLYAVGAMQQKKGLFLSAMKTLEECVRLDPEAVPPRRLLAKLYVSVGRPDDALAMAKSITERAPTDFEGWQHYAEQLNDLGKRNEAIAALHRSADCESAAKYPQQLLVILSRLGNWCEKGDQFEAAEKVRRRAVALLNANHDKFVNAGFLSESDFANEKADTWEKVGEDCLKNGRAEQAVEAFEQAREIYNGRNDAVAKARLHRLHWHLAQVDAARNKPREAVAEVQEYLGRIKTNSLEPYRLLIEQSRKLGESSEIPSRLEQYAHREADNLPFQLLLAEQYGNAGRFADAQEHYLKLLKKQVKPEIYQGLFRLYEKRDRMREVLEKLDEYCIELDKDKEQNEKKTEIPRKHVGAMMSVLARNPTMVRKLVPLADSERLRQYQQLRNFDYRTYERLADLLYRWDDLAEAERLLREALRSNVDNQFARQLNASTDEALILVLMARHKYADVKSLSRERLRVSDDNAYLYHVFLDISLAKLGEIDEALNVNKQAVDLAFRDHLKYRSRRNRAIILVQDGQLEQALQECQKLLKEFPTPQFVRSTKIQMAEVLSQLHRHEEAEKLLRELYDQDPNDASVCNYLGYGLADRNKNLDEAEKLIRRAIDLHRRARQQSDGDDAEPYDQDNAAYLDSLAWVLFRKGKVAEARQILEQVITQPDGKYAAEEWDHLGDVCFKSGDQSAAAKAWQRAIELYIESRPPKKDSRLPEAKRKLKLVK